MPTTSSLSRADCRNCPKLRTGLPTLTAPTIWLFQWIGAPTYMTALSGLAGSSGVVRAP